MRWRRCSSFCASARGALSDDAVDTVLACLDALSDAVDGIEDGRRGAT